MKSRQQANDPGKRPEEDTEAILSRRRFLVQSAMASAGAGAAVSVPGCIWCFSPDPASYHEPPESDDQPEQTDQGEPEPEPQVCLQPLE